MVDRGRLDYAKNLAFVNERILLAAPSRYSQELPQAFVPGNWDIICQGGRESFEHSKFDGTGFVFFLRRHLTRKDHVSVSWKPPISDLHRQSPRVLL